MENSTPEKPTDENPTSEKPTPENSTDEQSTDKKSKCPPRMGAMIAVAIALIATGISVGIGWCQNSSRTTEAHARMLHQESQLESATPRTKYRDLNVPPDNANTTATERRKPQTIT